MHGTTLVRDRWGLVIVRMTVGVLFIVHGWQKVVAGGGGIAFAGGLAHMGFSPAPSGPGS